MKLQTTILILSLFLGAFTLHGRAQGPGAETSPLPVDDGSAINANNTGLQKGSFFISPFFQFSSFENLKLVSHTNTYTLPEGNTTYEYTEEEINEYNNANVTSYSYSMTGVRAGYHLIDGLGVCVYAGIRSFNFESWKTAENVNSFTTDYPAFTFGASVDYIRKIKGPLSLMAQLSYDYMVTGSVKLDADFTEEHISSKVKTNYLETNLLLTYHTGRFIPYAGAGYTLQMVHPLTVEQIEISNEDSAPYTEVIEFDSHFTGNSIYALAGVQYKINTKISCYTNVTFPILYKANLGIKFII
jgi:hypothetical protein